MQIKRKALHALYTVGGCVAVVLAAVAVGAYLSAKWVGDLMEREP